MKDYKFWSTQPVPALDDVVETDGPIEQDKQIQEIRNEPYALPNGYEWCTVDLDDEMECKAVYELLSMNYVEDDDAIFRFDYSKQFLKWQVCVCSNLNSKGTAVVQLGEGMACRRQSSIHTQINGVY